MPWRLRRSANSALGVARSRVIGIDASRLSVAERTGTETYTFNLIHALADLRSNDDFRLYLNAALPPPDLPPLGDTVSMPFPRFWTHARLSWEMLRRPPEVLFVPAHVVPVLHPRSVVTIHDLGYLHEPEAHPTAQRRTLDWTTRWSCRSARRVIAISDATRRDLLTHYDVPPDRIIVIPHGVKPTRASEEDVARVRADHDLPPHFILAVGTIQPRKNLGRLARALSELARAGLEQHLVVAGKRGWLANEVEAEIAHSGASHRIALLGYVADDDLAGLYAAADALCFPSLYEGFGLPALEAMAAGCPVVVSNRGSLPEVAGDAAEIVDPLDVGSIAAGLIRVLTDNARRSVLIERGWQRASTFTWARTARETLGVLRAVRDE
ncbi:MAG: glycosyltransferase family 4 protein [Thermomicrobiales bacterium]